MRAYQLHAFDKQALKLEELPKPSPGPGEVLLRVLSASLNYRDLLMMKGLYDPRQALPLVPLSDCVGEVEELGEGVTQVRVGERACPIFAQKWLSGAPSKAKLRSTLGGPQMGTLQEYLIIPEESLVVIPESIVNAEACTLPCAGVTAYNALVSLGQLKEGEVVLVQGTGGVSLFALQIARAKGARVIATTSSPTKQEKLVTLGAEHVILYTQEKNWGAKARELAGGDGVDHVVEVGGSGTLEQSLRAVRPGGTVSVIGVLSGGKAELSLFPVMMNQVRLQGVMVGPKESFQELVHFCEGTNLRPVVDQIFPFEAAIDAFEHLESGKHFGKVVIQVSSPASA